MRMTGVVLVLALGSLGGCAGAGGGPAAHHAAPVRDGRTEASAIRVRSVADEYRIVRERGLASTQQALILRDHGKAYDVLTLVDPDGSPAGELWFDISSFYGHELG